MQKTEAARSCHADDKQTTPDVRGTGERAGAVIVETHTVVDSGTEAASAFAKLLVDEFRLVPCAVSGVRVEEPAAAAAHTEPARAEVPAKLSNPLRAIDAAVLHNDDDNRRPEGEIEGRDGGLRDYAVAVDYGELDDEEAEVVRQESYVAPRDSGGASAAAAAVGVRLQLRRTIEGRDGGLRDYAVAVDDGELDDEEQEAVRQNSYMTPRDSGGASAAAAAVGHRLQLRRTIGDFYAECSVFTDVLTRQEKSPSPSVSDDASATRGTYDDITKSPPPRLRCVVSPLSSLSPVLRRTAASLPCFVSPTSRG